MLLLSASYTPTPLTDTPESTWMAGLAVKGCRLPCNPKSNGVLSYISFIEEEKGHESDEIDQGSMSSKKKRDLDWRLISKTKASTLGRISVPYVGLKISKRPDI